MFLFFTKIDEKFHLPVGVIRAHGDKITGTDCRKLRTL